MELAYYRRDDPSIEKMVHGSGRGQHILKSENDTIVDLTRSSNGGAK